MSGVETNETRDLISSDKVEGTSVYDRNGNNLGTISNVMLDKRSGQVDHAVLSFGGFLGMGSSYHPLPWDQLHYDSNQGGYLVDITKEQLEGAPTYSATEEARWQDPAYGRSIDAYYSSVEGKP
jgi:sporulation protein YlmC with PRC-barrel domain